MAVVELSLLEYADMMRACECVMLGDMGGFRYFVVRHVGDLNIYKVEIP